jgi:uncharacterized protein (DUF952 family)
MHKGRIFHLITPQRWEKALIEGHYRPESLQKEGFIHCSSWDQLLESAERHYKDADTLVVVFIIEKHVKKELVWEKSRNGEDFPHLYGQFPFGAVETTKLMVRNAQGKFELQAE